MAWYQKLSDELIVPNLDQDISFFYEPGTKKLRKRFHIYPDALAANVQFANDLERTHILLLKSTTIKPLTRHAICHSDPAVAEKNLRIILDRCSWS